MRRLAERRLRSALGPGARIGRLQVLPAGLSLIVHDLSLEGPGYAAEVPEARLALSPATLLGGPLSVEHLELRAPRLALRSEPAGAKAASPAFARPVLVRDLHVTGATLSYDDPALGGEVSLRGVELHGGIGGGTLELSVAGGEWKRSKPVALGPASARMRLSPSLELRLESFEAGTAASRLTASGTLGRPGAIRPQLDLGAHVDLAELATLAEAPAMSGTLTAKGRVAADGAAIHTEAAFTGQNLAVASWPVDRATLRVTHDGGRTTASLGLEVLGGRLDGEGRLAGSTVDAHLRIAAIDVERLRRRVAPDGPPLEGALSGDVRWKGDLAKSLDAQASLTANAHTGTTALLVLAEASGAVRPKDLSVDLRWTAAAQGEGAGAGLPWFKAARVAVKGTASGPIPPPVDGVFEGTLAFDSPAGAQEVALGGRLGLRGNEASVALEARGVGGALSVAAETTGARLRRLALQGDSLRLEPFLAGLRGRASLALETSGPAESLSATGHVRVDELAWRDVAIGTTTASLEATKGLGDWTLDVPALKASGHGQLRTGRQADLTGTLTLTGTPLAFLVPLLPRALPVDGQASGSVEVAVPLSRPEAAEIRARLDSVEAASGRFSARTTRPMTLALRDRRLSVDDLAVDGSGLSLTASGSFGLDSQAPVDARITADLDLAHLPAPDGWKLAGSARAECAVTGPLAHPQAEGAVTGRGIAIEAPRLPPVQVAEGRLDLAGDVMVVPGLTASLAGGSLSVSGRVPVAAVLPAARARPGPPAAGEQATVDVEWRGLEAAAIFEARAPGQPASAGASFCGRAHIEGGLAAPAEVRGVISVPPTALQVAELPLEVDAFEARIDGGRIGTEGITLRGEGGAFLLAGGVDLAQRALDLTGKGTLQLRALSAFLGAASLTGSADVDLAVKGPLDAPQPSGTLSVREATFRLRDIPEALTEVKASVVFDETTVRIENASALLGGGPVTVAGAATLHGTTLGDVRLTLTGRDMALRYPAGLKSRLNADLSLSGRTGAFLLAGTVEAVRGLYDLDVAVQETLLAPVVAAVESPLLRSIGLDIAIAITNPVRVHNNLAELRAGGSLVMRGTMERSEPYGRVEIEPQGKVFVQGQDFRITSGRLEYDGTWNAQLSVEAETEKPIRDNSDGKEYRVDIDVQGALETLGLQDIRFESQPPGLSRDQIWSLMATGSSEKAVGGAAIAGTQAASLVTARLGREVSRGLSGLGLGQVTLRPELLARETDPGARFTFESQLTRIVTLIYSVGLNDAESRFVRLEARGRHDVTLFVQRQDDGSVSYGAGQKLKWGGHKTPMAPEEQKTRLADVRLEGDRPLPERELRGALDARPRRKVLAWDLQDDADRLRERLRRAGYLEAEVGARLEGEAAVFSVRSGPVYRWRVGGMPDPPDLSSEMRQALFEEEALERGTARLLSTLRDRGHLRARVTAKAVDEGSERTVAFVVEPGPSLTVAEVSFPGATALAESRLLRVAGGPAALLAAPGEAAKAIHAEYTRRHYLRVAVGPPRIQEAGGQVRIAVPIREGEPARLAAVRFDGSTLTEDELARAAAIETGPSVSDAQIAAAAERVRAHYLEHGYASVRVVPELLPAEGDLDAVFHVTEGERVVIGAVEITGLAHTRESLVRGEIRFQPGDPLDPRKLAALERRLLDLGLFSRAAVTASGSPATVRVAIEEGPKLTAEYDVRYSNTEGATVVLDAEKRNVLGLGLDLGGRYRVGADIREQRGSLHLRSVFSGQITASLFRIEEDLPAVDIFTGEPITNVRLRRGLDLQHRSRLGERTDLLVGYLFRRVSTTTNPEPLTVATLRLSLIRNTRDNPLDARRGRFLTASLELSPKALASDFTFVKGFAQAFLSRPLGTSWTWAQGYRLGLAHGFGGQMLIFDDRFKAGGDSSLRGFATDAVGPKDFFGDPSGGQAVVILNQELRYRHAKGLGAAVFYDAGNVFDTVSAIGLDLRHDLGLGLRYESPVGLLRLDVASPLGRQEGEKRYRVIFSLGQAF